MLWLKKFKGDFLLNSYPKDIANLLLDTNGIIHKAAQITFGYGGKTEEEKKEEKKLREKNKKLDYTTLMSNMFKNMEKLLDEIIYAFKPKSNLIICPDGVAPAGKIQQQKLRRFKNELSDDIPFNTSLITPGTDLAFTLDNFFKMWIKKNKMKFENNLNIIYSGFDVPGEGEHKIFDFFRENKDISEYDINKNTVIYGLDADLVVLSVLSDIKNFYLIRENLKDVIHIDELRKSIIDELKFEGCDERNLLKDFSLLVSFSGNDFLPKFPFYVDTNVMTTFMFDMYNKLNKHITNNNMIIIENFKELLILLSENDYMLYEQVYKKRIQYPYYEIKKYCTIKDDMFFIYKKEFRESWYKKEFSPPSYKYIKRTDDLYINNRSYKDQLVELYKEKEEEFYDPGDIDDMCLDYVSTLQWILCYYIMGRKYVNDNFFYKYNHTPMLEDIISLLRIPDISKKILYNSMNKNEEVSVLGIHQLIMVLPQNSVDIIDDKYLDYYIKAECFNPETFKIDLEGVSQEWQGHPIIPVIDPYTISFLLKEEPLKKYKKGEVVKIKNIIGYKDILKKEKRSISREINNIFKEDLDEGLTEKESKKFVKKTGNYRINNEYI